MNVITFDANDCISLILWETIITSSETDFVAYTFKFFNIFEFVTLLSVNLFSRLYRSALVELSRTQHCLNLVSHSLQFHFLLCYIALGRTLNFRRICRTVLQLMTIRIVSRYTLAIHYIIPIRLFVHIVYCT